MGKINTSPIRASDFVVLLRAWDLCVWAALLWRPVVVHTVVTKWRGHVRYQVPTWCALIGSRSGSHLQTTTPHSHPSQSRLYWFTINLLFQRHGVWCWQERLSNTGSWEDLSGSRSRDDREVKMPHYKSPVSQPSVCHYPVYQFRISNQPTRREGSIQLLLWSTCWYAIVGMG